MISAIGEREREAGVAGDPWSWGKGDIARRVNGDGAASDGDVLGCARSDFGVVNEGDGQRVAIRVGCTVREIKRNGGVSWGVNVLRCSNGCVIDRSEGEAQGCGVAQGAIGDGVSGDWNRAVEVSFRGKEVITVCFDSERAHTCNGGSRASGEGFLATVAIGINSELSDA